MSFRLQAVSAALASLALVGTALAAQGDPIGGVGVSVEQSPGGMVVASANTDRSGIAAPSGVKAGSYRLTFTGAGGKTLTAVVKNGTASVATLSATCPREGKCGPTSDFKVQGGAALSVMVTEGR